MRFSVRVAKSRIVSKYKIKHLGGGRLLFHVNDKGRISWDLFVMVLAVFNCLSVPYLIAYEPEVCQF